jgi:hypothetical protein
MPLEKKNDDDDAYLSCDNADDLTFVPPVIFPEKLSDGRWVSGDFDLDEELDRDYITGMLEYKQQLIDLGHLNPTTNSNPFINGTYSSCVGDKTVVADESSGVVKVNRRFYMEPEPNNLLTHRNENDPL